MRSPETRRGLVAGAIAGGVLVALMYLLGPLAGLRPLPQLLQQPILDLMPGAVFGFLIDNLQHAGKVVEEASLIVGMTAGLALLGGVYGYLRLRRSIPHLAMVVAAAGWLVVTGVLLLLQMLMRLALVDVLLVLSPIALAFWILPQTQRWSSQWSTTFFGAVLTQFVQVVALKLGGALLKELGPMSLDTAAIEILLGTALMVLTLKLPGIIGRHAGDGLGLARFLTYRQGARGVDAAASRVP